MKASLQLAAWTLLATVLTCTRASAQNMLLAEHDGKFLPVIGATGAQARVEVDDKPVIANGRRFVLRKTEEFAPYFVSIHKLKVTNRFGYNEDGAELNKVFELRAELESPYRLENAFLVLDLKSDREGSMLFVWEVGTLLPRQAKPVVVTAPVDGQMGETKYTVQIFSNGHELLHSGMPFAMVEGVLDRMVAQRIKGVTDANPTPFVGPAPEYPEKLRAAKVKGEAILAFTISRRGTVVEPTVKRATDPAFGEAALAAARMWRFLPKVVKGAATEMKVEMPFAFTPDP